MRMPAQETTTAATRRSSEPASVTLLNSSHGIGTFIFAALAVLAAYVHLLMISISYIKLVLIPVIMLAFIGAVGGKFYSSGRRQYYDNNSETGFANRVEMLVALAAVTFVPQLVQLLCTGLDKFVGLGQQQNDSFLISHFLFFFSSAVGALQVMMVTLRVAKVSEVLRMTFSVVLQMALHAKAAEWVGEDMVLVCMPELIAALLWFFDHFDHGGYTISIDNVISFESGGIILGAAVILLSMFAYEWNIVPMFRVLVSCTLSGMLSYFSMWIFGSDDSAKVPIQLLKCSAYVCFGISAILVSWLAILHLRLYVFNLVETVTSFIEVEAAQMLALAVFVSYMFGLLFLFVALRNQVGVGAPSSTSSRPLYPALVVMIIIIHCYLITWRFEGESSYK